MVRVKVFTMILMGMILISFPSCNGILGDIYDEPQKEEESPYGFIEVDEENHKGRIFIDATSYAKWTYLDFETKTIQVVDIDPKNEQANKDNEPQAWSFAMHRYDAKTNKGRVLETPFVSLMALKQSGTIPQGTYVADVWDKVIYDLSGMMDDNVIYSNSDINYELTKWLDVDKSTMPPHYTPSNKVYVIQLKDGKYAALHYFNYMDNSNQKGYITIDYIYPLEF